MGFFTFPGQQEHRKFNYRQIYYDKDEEELMALLEEYRDEDDTV